MPVVRSKNTDVMDGNKILFTVFITLAISSKRTLGQNECIHTICTDGRECKETEACLCEIDTCNNRSCACLSNYFRNASGQCSPKKNYNASCSDSIECATLFSDCIGDGNDNATGSKKCQCRESLEYDEKLDKCTNAPPCPFDDTFIYNRDQHNCHKLIKGCNDCTNVSEICSKESKDGTVVTTLSFRNNMIGRLASTLWAYGIFQYNQYNYSTAPSILTTTFLQQDELVCEFLVFRMINDSLFHTFENNNDCQTKPVTVVCGIELPSINTYCSEDKDTTGRFWKATEVGVIATQNCPVSYEGTITRECKSDGRYSEPVNNCTLAALIDIKNKLGSDAIDVNSALTSLNNETGLVEQLFVKDVVIVQDILDDIVEKSGNVTLNDKSIEGFFNVTNILLNQTRQKTYNEHSPYDKRDIGVERFLTRTGIFVENVAHQNKTVSLTFSYIEIEISQLPTDPKDIRFPNESQGKSSLFLAKEAFTGKGIIVNTYSTVLFRNTASSNRYLESVNSLTIESTINSDVLSLSLYPKVPISLDPPLVLYLFPEREAHEGYSQKCAYLDESKMDGLGSWSSDGCNEVIANNTLVQCQCNHLTNFAILLSPVEAHPKHDSVLRIISLVGCLISVLFLLITIFLYSYYWRIVRSDNSILTMLLCASLLVAYVVFMAGVDRTAVKGVCSAIAALLHYLYLVVFFVMLSKAIHMMILVILVTNKQSYVIHYIIGSLVTPAVVVGISLGASGLENYGSDKYCWLVAGSGVFWGFAGVILGIILINLTAMGIVVYKICSTTATKNKSTHEKVKITMWSLCILLPIMGVTWLFGIFSLDENTVVFQYLFVILNVFQGFGIFIFHCVFNKQMKAAIMISRKRKQTREEINLDLKNKNPKSKDKTGIEVATADTREGILSVDSSICVTDTKSSTDTKTQTRRAEIATRLNESRSVRKTISCALHDFRTRVGLGGHLPRRKSYNQSQTSEMTCVYSESSVGVEQMKSSEECSFTKQPATTNSIPDATALATLSEEERSSQI